MSKHTETEKMQKLREALTDMFALIEEQQLVRNTSQDSDDGFTIRQLKFVSRLAKANQALEETKS